MDITQVFTIVFIIALILFAIFIRAPFGKKEKKRTEEFVQIASDLQMSFSNKVDRSFLNRLKPFKRFRIRPHRTSRNMLYENKNDVQMVFFECYNQNRTGGSHVSGRNVMEGIFYFSSSSLKIPSFTLHEAEELQQVFLGAFGVKDINFENHPVFSKKYLLTSDDETAVRRLFSDELASFLEKLNGINIEGCDNQLIVYRPTIRIETSKFKQLKQEAVQIFEHSCE